MKDDPHHSHHNHPDRGLITAENPAKPFADPVCGMKVATAPGKLITHAGQDYHFCSNHCMEKFSADPLQYLNPAAKRPLPDQESPVGTV